MSHKTGCSRHQRHRSETDVFWASGSAAALSLLLLLCQCCCCSIIAAAALLLLLPYHCCCPITAAAALPLLLLLYHCCCCPITAAAALSLPICKTWIQVSAGGAWGATPRTLSSRNVLDFPIQACDTAQESGRALALERGKGWSAERAGANRHGCCWRPSRLCVAMQPRTNQARVGHVGESGAWDLLLRVDRCRYLRVLGAHLCIDVTNACRHRSRYHWLAQMYCSDFVQAPPGCSRVVNKLIPQLQPHEALLSGLHPRQEVVTASVLPSTLRKWPTCCEIDAIVLTVSGEPWLAAVLEDNSDLASEGTTEHVGAVRILRGRATKPQHKVQC